MYCVKRVLLEPFDKLTTSRSRRRVYLPPLFVFYQQRCLAWGFSARDNRTRDHRDRIAPGHPPFLPGEEAPVDRLVSGSTCFRHQTTLFCFVPFCSRSDLNVNSPLSLFFTFLLPLPPCWIERTNELGSKKERAKNPVFHSSSSLSVFPSSSSR